jgi:hypothetical protein
MYHELGSVIKSGEIEQPKKERVCANPSKINLKANGTHPGERNTYFGMGE